MSFRNRLTLFFVLIVVVPMVSVGFVLFRLIADNESGKADAQLGTQQRVAIGLVEEAEEQAKRAAIDIGRDLQLAQALRFDDRSAMRRRAEELLRREDVLRIAISRGGRPLIDVGDPRAILPASRDLVGAGNKSFGRLQVSVAEPTAYSRRFADIASTNILVRVDGDVVASTIADARPVKFPVKPGDVDIRGETWRAVSFFRPGFLGSRVKISVLHPKSTESNEVDRARVLAAGILLGFFVLAFTFAMLVSRSLQRQIDSFLHAARRLGGGDFSTQVPTSGRDEFAALGDEFNKMSAQLRERLEELSLERVRLREAMRRIGETFASNLDRERLLEIVVRTAIDGLGADAGRASVRPSEADPLEQVASAGKLNGLEDAIRVAESRVLATGLPSEAQVDGTGALSHPLRQEEHRADLSGLVSVARHGRAFTADERELFHYLAGQAAVSIENVGLHETVEQQAVTDELTGLHNRRRFQETMQIEVERAKRFDQPLGLVMLDLDDFKLVNDTYGHQQGDVVLREVARVLKESSREIDEPARYGGEELAVVLPVTDLDGAFNLAERVRLEIERLALPRQDGGTLRVTASFGVATLPQSANDLGSLIEAADEALYRAKRAGKNRTVRAG